MACVHQNLSSIEAVFTFSHVLDLNIENFDSTISPLKSGSIYPMSEMTLCSCLPPREAVVFSIYLSWIEVTPQGYP